MSATLDRGCMCIFRGGCAGLGTIYCSGCGGDLCICTCGGELECEGCEMCDQHPLEELGAGLDDDDFLPELGG